MLKYRWDYSLNSLVLRRFYTLLTHVQIDHAPLTLLLFQCIKNSPSRPVSSNTYFPTAENREMFHHWRMLSVTRGRLHMVAITLSRAYLYFLFPSGVQPINTKGLRIKIWSADSLRCSGKRIKRVKFQTLVSPPPPKKKPQVLKMHCLKNK